MTSVSHYGDDVRLRGVSICPGIGIGRIRKVDLDILIPQDNLDLPGIAVEQDRYSRAVDTARRHLPEHVATVHGDPLPEAKAIFGVHQAILADESFHSKVRNRIAAERKRAEFCLDQEANALISAFDGTRDPYFKARGEDIRDMAYNLLAVLSNSEDDVHRPRAREDVVLSRHLHSSHAIMAHRGHVRGFASESKALASHAAILLKGFAIPSVGGVPGLLDVAPEGDRIIVDGTNGLVIVRPSSRTEKEYEARKRAAETSLSVEDVMPCTTRDGVEKRMLPCAARSPRIRACFPIFCVWDTGHSALLRWRQPWFETCARRRERNDSRCSSPCSPKVLYGSAFYW